MSDQQSPTDDQKLDLAELFRKYGSDKDINEYSQVYFTLFDKMKDMKLNFLEIGIGTMIPGAHSSMVGYAPAHYKPGASLRAWRDFMPNSRIIGLDIQLDTQFSDEERIETYLCYSVGTDEVNRWHEKMDGLMFDVIIDDGSHVASDQLITLSNFYPMLKPGGIYIIEDVVENSALSTNPESIKEKCNGDPFFFVGVKNNICVIYKKSLNSNRAGY